MKVLSLFDGISCTRVALAKANIPVELYHASEIDKYAISVSEKNYPDIKHIGNVKDISNIDFQVDLLIGGSPCQDLSIGNKNRKGLAGDRSSLFWDYVRIKNLCNPKYFILENVASMSSDNKLVITQALGVEPIMINASLVSAQSRKRLFWTNIPNVVLPVDRNIKLVDIIQPEVDNKYYVKTDVFTSNDKSNGKGYIGFVGNAKVPGQGNRVKNVDNKSNCVYTAGAGLYKIGRNIGRRLNEDGVRDDNNKDTPITRRIELRDDDKCGTLTSVLKDNIVVNEDRIRRLTPIECERLQGLPDNYTNCISDTQRYKCLGNAFNVDVIAHILSFLPK